jgi:hypothetical protein
MFLISVVWGISSYVKDKYNYYVISYPLFTFFIGIEVNGIFQWVQKRWYNQPRILKFSSVLAAIVVILPVTLYSLTPPMVKTLDIDLVQARKIPVFRDNDWYFLFPPKNGYYGARDYAFEALQSVQPSSVILSDYTLYQPLKYVQIVEHVRQDVIIERCFPSVILTQVAQNIDVRPVYLAALEPPDLYQIDSLQLSYTFVPNGPIFEVRKR